MQDQILQAVQEKGAKTVALQVPEGLKKEAGEWIQKLEKNGIQVYTFISPCFGACDLCHEDAKKLGCEVLIHVGHSDIGVETDIPVLYVEYQSELDISKITEKAGKEIKETIICLTTTLQHIKQLNKAKEILEEAGKEVVIAESGTRAKYPGQILGCDPGAALNQEAEAYLHIGTGNFHPLEIALATGKKVYVADPELGEVRVFEDEKDKFLRKRFAKIENSKDAKKIGILLSTKTGQNRKELAEKLVEMCKENGKEGHILVTNHISPDNLLGYGFDAYVSTACPRIAIDDADNYDKPLLTPQELEVVLGIREWENYKLDRF
jgi:2-(3-amino-3-carboxypropyl)histidine synthase